MYRVALNGTSFMESLMEFLHLIPAVLKRVMSMEPLWHRE
jgi:hypothetical protein